MLKKAFLALGFATITTAPAFAHLDPAHHGSFAAGFSHPLFGLDHVLAMLAVGLWAAVQRGRALWIVPLAFVVAMALGFAAAVMGIPLPLVEPMVLASVVFIGIAIALALPVPTGAVAAIIGFFAVFHGHAHGGELGTAGAIEFATGFLVATIAIHAVGIALGLFVSRFGGSTLFRIAGAGTALGGVFLAFNA